MHNEAVSTVFASLGAVCWSLQILPQIYLNHKRHKTDGFSALMMALWVCAGVPLGIYNITRDLNIGLQIQPQCFMLFATICGVQTYHYRLGWSYYKSGGIVFVCMVVLAVLETAGIELLNLGLRNDVEWPVTFVGVISAVLINVGLIPQYYEIYKRNAVVGVSYLFLGIDCAGAVFSFMSLPFDQWDILAAISYGLLVVEECGIFALGLAFWIRDRKGKAADEDDSTNGFAAAGDGSLEESGRLPKRSDLEGAEAGSQEKQGMDEVTEK